VKNDDGDWKKQHRDAPKLAHRLSSFADGTALHGTFKL
jgi:hypothetical protein